MILPRCTLAAALVLAPPLVHAFDTVVVFNEIHYHPAGVENRTHEFVELHNQQSVRVDLSEWRISGGIDFEFPRGTVVEPGGYLVVAPDPAVLQAAGVGGVLGPYTGFLNNGGEVIRLRNNNDRIMDEIDYRDRAPWPVGADGSGASLSKLDPQTKGDWAREWSHSQQLGGTPGRVNFGGASEDLSLNEVAGSAVEPGAYFIEFYNAGEVDRDLGGYVIASETGQEHVIAPGLIAPRSGHVLVAETVLGFRVADGDNLYFYAPGKAVLIDALRSDDAGQARYPDGGDDLLVTGNGVPASPGGPNPPPGPSAVVINEIMYHHASEDGEEWVELYNTRDVPVPVGGWVLDGAVRFTIPVGVMIPENGYLVVTGDAAGFSAKFPGVATVGDFSGSLSNRGEELVLRDAAGNPADRVCFRNDKPWPPEADGGGSSLELRNPFIDNSQPAAWAASDNAATSEWHDYVMTIEATRPAYAPNLFSFHELRIGLLDSGVIMLDDFSVIEDPGGVNLELMSRGDFDSATGWRFLGTHENSGLVSEDGNSVLRVAAEGPMNYLNNLIESNLATSRGILRAVVPGTTYRIAFRAKWISGSPQFRFELYYNQIAKTVILPRPAALGTPGARNSTYEEDTGPVYEGLTHSPAVPAPGEPIEVSTAASDPSGVSSMSLRYALDGRRFSSIPMTLDPEDARWKATIPGQADGVVIQFYVSGTDGGPQRLASTTPAGGGLHSRALIKVDGTSAHGDRRSIRIIMLPTESSALHAPDDILSNRRFGCTLITDEETIAYDAGIRLRGSMWSRRNSGTTALNLKFPADRRYRGVHSTITTRRGNRQEILVKHIINQAGGIHDSYNDILYQYGHIPAQNGAVRSEMARFGAVYLRGLPGGGGNDGTVFKMEGIREFQATRDGTPESPKKPFPIGWIRTFDIADQGDDKEQYRHNMRINGNFETDDYTSIIRMCQTFSLDQQELEDAVPAAIDVDRWTRQFAALSLCGIGDTYSQGNPHNLNFYARPSDGIVESMPWDWDFVFNRSSQSPLWGDRNVSKIFARPVYARLFQGHLRDIIRNTYNTRHLNRWFTHYGQVSGEDYTGNLAYITERSNFVLSQLPAQVAFGITTNGGGPITSPGPFVTLEGTGWIDVREVVVGGRPDPLPLTWTGGESWRVTVPVVPGVQTLELTALDHQGRTVGSDSVVVDVTGSIEPAGAANLAISEIMYHPATNGAEEFVEIINISASDAIVDLTGVAFTEGISFEFPDGTRLGPGERLLVVENLAAFEFRYGEGLPVAGEFANASRLNNAGERIRLETITGETIRDFSYDTKAPWPTTPDTHGTSLVMIDPANGDPTIGASWTASFGIGGTPGTAESGTPFGAWMAARGETDPLAVKPGEPVPNLLSYAFGLDLAGGDAGVALPRLGEVVIGEESFLSYEYRRRLGDPALGFTVEISRDGLHWSDGAPELVVVAVADEGDGTERVTVRLRQPLGSEEVVLLRVRVSPGRPGSGSAFEAWMAARGETDPLATKSGEPVSNLLSYAFGLDLAGGDIGVALPKFGVVSVDGHSFLSYDYRRRLSDPTLGYTVEISSDGLNWSDGAPDLVQVEIREEGDGTERVMVRLQDPLGSAKTRLLRVRVEAP